ncbi:MAG: hypothetical protein R2769_04140 [Saprospiraceae bacterium]
MTEVPIGGYNKLLFNVGLTNDQNAMIPADFPAGHPLNNTGALVVRLGKLYLL